MYVYLENIAIDEILLFKSQIMMNLKLLRLSLVDDNQSVV